MNDRRGVRVLLGIFIGMVLLVAGTAAIDSWVLGDGDCPQCNLTDAEIRATAEAIATQVIEDIIKQDVIWPLPERR